jgi:hypothetical protein
MGIETKTFATLIDELITTSNRAWHAQDDIMNTSLSDEKRFQASLRAHEANFRRNQLIRSIDAMFGNSDFTQSEKTYSEQFKSK